MNLETKISLKLILILVFGSILYFVSDRNAIYGLQQDVFQYEASDSTSMDMDVIDGLMESYIARERGGNPILAPAAAPEKKPLPPHLKNVQEKYEAMGDNKKAVGWITIPGTKTDRAIMYDKDNEYFLTHNEQGMESKNGSIYMDSSNQGVFGQVTLLHGHNMKSGEMFGELDNYKDSSYTKKNLAFQVASAKGANQYKIFSVFVLDGSKESIRTSFQADGGYAAYVTGLKNRSMFPLASPDKLGHVLLLHTCSYEFSDAHLIIAAYQLQ